MFHLPRYPTNALIDAAAAIDKTTWYPLQQVSMLFRFENFSERKVSGQSKLYSTKVCFAIRTLLPFKVFLAFYPARDLLGDSLVITFLMRGDFSSKLEPKFTLSYRLKYFHLTCNWTFNRFYLCMQNLRNSVSCCVVRALKSSLLFFSKPTT